MLPRRNQNLEICPVSILFAITVSPGAFRASKGGLITAHDKDKLVWNFNFEFGRIDPKENNPIPRPIDSMYIPLVMCTS
jgi:hypothetical protein